MRRCGLAAAGEPLAQLFCCSLEPQGQRLLWRGGTWCPTTVRLVSDLHEHIKTVASAEGQRGALPPVSPVESPKMGPEWAAVRVFARLAGVGCINAMGPLTCTNRRTPAGQGSRVVRALTRATAPARSTRARHMAAPSRQQPTADRADSEFCRGTSDRSAVCFSSDAAGPLWVVARSKGAGPVGGM